MNIYGMVMYLLYSILPNCTVTADCDCSCPYDIIDTVILRRAMVGLPVFGQQFGAGTSPSGCVISGRPIADVYFVGGQSNALARFGDAADLSSPHNAAQTDIRHWFNIVNSDNNRSGAWVDLKPESSAGYVGAGTLPSTYFGPEIGMGHDLRDNGPADRNVYIVKHAEGGRCLAAQGGDDDWSITSTGENYDRLIDEVTLALDDIRNVDNKTPVMRGMGWQQGFCDANTSGDANAYETNLNNLIADLRTRYGAGFRFALNRIHSKPGSEKPFETEVRTAQVNVGNASTLNAWIDIDDLTFEPGEVVHYDSASIKLMGERMAAQLQ